MANWGLAKFCGSAASILVLLAVRTAHAADNFTVNSLAVGACQKSTTNAATVLFDWSGMLNQSATDRLYLDCGQSISFAWLQLANFTTATITVYLLDQNPNSGVDISCTPKVEYLNGSVAWTGSAKSTSGASTSVVPLSWNAPIAGVNPYVGCSIPQSFGGFSSGIVSLVTTYT